MRAASPAIAPALRRHPLRALLGSEYLTVGLCGVWAVVAAPFAPGFFSADNAVNVLGVLLPLLVAATGQTVVLIVGGIDLSVTSIIALTSVLGASVVTAGGGWLAGHPLAVPLGVGAMCVAGAGLGALNGAAVALLRMPAFIVTLTSMMFLSGLAIWSTRSQNISQLPDSFLVWGRSLPMAAVLAVGFCGLVHLGLERTLGGRWAYAVGQNPAAARVSGVPVSGVILGAFVLSGCSAALAALLLTGRLETGSPVHARELLLDIIGATVIGGTSLFGGKGRVTWTVFGVLFLALVDSGLNLMNCSHFTLMMAKGGVILAAALLDTLRTRWSHP